MRLRITIEHDDGTTREVTIRPEGQVWAVGPSDLPAYAVALSVRGALAQVAEALGEPTPWLAGGPPDRLVRSIAKNGDKK